MGDQNSPRVAVLADVRELPEVHVPALDVARVILAGVREARVLERELRAALGAREVERDPRRALARRELGDRVGEHETLRLLRERHPALGGHAAAPLEAEL